MELRHIRYFKAVAEELNFTRAAEKLNIAQPPLSRQIQDLERDLGTKLFIRNPHKILLTHEGRTLSPICQSDSGPGKPVSRRSTRSKRRITGNPLYCICRRLWSPVFCRNDFFFSKEISPCSIQPLERKFR